MSLSSSGDVNNHRGYFCEPTNVEMRVTARDNVDAILFVGVQLNRRVRTRKACTRRSRYQPRVSASSGSGGDDWERH
jgi:hypothetical protein